jgi:photosystem II stability/assembly factor-like uncharacterized protein
MDTDSAPGLREWLEDHALAIIAVLAIILLLVAVWKRPALFPSAYPSPASPTPTSPTPPSPTLLPKQWTVLFELFDGQINALRIEGAGGVRLIYAGTEGGVFKSEDRGITWIPRNDGLDNRLVRALAVDPDDPKVLYAGSWNGQVHASEDGGSSWEQRSAGLPAAEIRALAVHTHDPRKLYAGTPAGVFTTNNAGRDWHPAGQFTGTLQCLAMEAEQPNILYVGTAGHGIYKSFDSGASWIRLRTEFTDVSSLLIPPRAARTVYAISAGKVWKTENAGLVWTYADYWRDPSVAYSLATNPKNPQEVYVGLQDGLHKSTDGRKTWIRSDLGLTDKDVQVLAVDPMEPTVVYACTGNQLWVSRNSGRTWQQRSSIQAYSEASILALKADPKDGQAFYASVAGGGLYRTLDSGEHWEHIGASLPVAQITAIDVDPVITQTIYVGTRDGFVYRSGSGGTTWASGSRVAEAPIQSLAVDPEQRNRIYAGTLGQGLFRSDNAGAQWARKGASIGNDVHNIVIDPRGPATTLYARTDRDVFRSLDAGENWEPYLTRVAAFALPLKGSGRPIAMTLADPTLVTGQGQSESILVPQNRIAAAVELRGMTASPAEPGTLYVLAEGEGVFCSGDSGSSWTSLGAGLQSRGLQALALSPDDPDLILVGTERGIYRYWPIQ